MDIAAIISVALKGIGAATDAIALFQRSIQAANEGRQDEAEKLLEKARAHYSASRADWDAAGPGS